MIARKSLYALHYSNFVDELYFRSLGHLVDGSSQNQSIFLDVNQRMMLKTMTWKRQWLPLAQTKHIVPIC